MVLLKNWTFDGIRFHGNAYGHPDFKDGEYVHTSRVKGILLMGSTIGIVQTQSRIYVFDPANSVDIASMAVVNHKGSKVPYMC